MSQIKQIKEEDGTHKAWMEKAKSLKTVQELTEFVEELTTKYGHDYGTICHAIAAAAIGAAHVVERSPQGGITGFQAGAVMWEIIRGWGIWGKGPLEVIEWDNLLYPQYDDKMPRTIGDGQFRRVVESARELVKKGGEAAPAVAERWRLLAEGQLPPGMKIRAD